MINFSIDLESIENFKNPATFNFFLSELEKKDKTLISLIGKVAAKKAFFKSLKVKKEFKKIEVINSHSGKPTIKIKDKSLKAKLKNKRISISISHTKDLAVAICLIYERKN